MYKLDNVIQKVEDFLREYMNLLFSIVTFFFGIKEILNNEEKHSSEWFMLLVSLGFLGNYIKDKSTNERLKKACNILSYGITACILIWFVAVII